MKGFLQEDKASVAEDLTEAKQQEDADEQGKKDHACTVVEVRRHAGEQLVAKGKNGSNEEDDT